eukprot:3003652-Amphidinium_carterae.1
MLNIEAMIPDSDEDSQPFRMGETHFHVTLSRTLEVSGIGGLMRLPAGIRVTTTKTVSSDYARDQMRTNTEGVLQKLEK